uniref:Uncharacterized protein n=1 Tax=Glossina austeni TaxID=7395 RepID=A0A1A9UU19_GLOAU
MDVFFCHFRQWLPRIPNRHQVLWYKFFLDLILRCTNSTILSTPHAIKRVIKSAELLDGVPTNRRALGINLKISKMLSTSVTVFPVSGGPKITSHRLPLFTNQANWTGRRNNKEPLKAFALVKVDTTGLLIPYQCIRNTSREVNQKKPKYV